MSAESVYGYVRVEHRIPWRDGLLKFTSYELEIVLRLASGDQVPLDHLPIASAFAARFKKAGLDLKEIAAAISTTVMLAPPHLHFIDDDAIGDDPMMLRLAEMIYVAHNDRWREQDAVDRGKEAP